MTYTKDIEKQKYFLNDKNISHALSDDSDGLNPLPSLKLVDELYNELTAVDDSISSDLNTVSSTVDKEFVHISGDTVNKLSVQNVLLVSGQLQVDGIALLKNTLVAKGNFAQGEGSVIPDAVRAVAMGRKAIARTDGSFVWNGNNDNLYFDHGHSTFNINPENGLNGVYVGNSTVSALIHNDIQLTATQLTNTIKILSGELSSTVDKNRKTDIATVKKELSDYIDDSIANYDGVVNGYRQQDKIYLTKTLSDYADSKFSTLSDSVDNAKYAVAETLNIDYDKDTRNIYVEICDKFNNKRKSLLSFDKITDSQIVDRVEVLQPPEVESTSIRIWWMPRPEHTETQRSTTIPLSQLAQAYKAGYGIKIDENLYISIDTSIVPTTDAINELNGKIRAISDEIDNVIQPEINVVKSDVATIQTYVDQLSSEDGIINKITASICEIYDGLEAVNDRFESDELSINVVSTDVDSLKDDVKSLSDDQNIITANVACLSGRLPKQLVYTGHLKVDYSKVKAGQTQDWEIYGNNLSDVIRYYDEDVSAYNQVHNGAVYQIMFTNIDGCTSADKAKFNYQTGDKFNLIHNDYIVVHSHDDVDYIDISDISPDYVYSLQSVKFDEFNQLSNNMTKVYIKNEVDGICGQSDLSVVKIDKEDFDDLVASDEPALCGNTLYVVNSNYIDAYGQAISNLVMSADVPDEATVPSEAANKNYVDYVSADIVDKLDDFKRELYDAFSTTLMVGDMPKEENAIALSDVTNCMHNVMAILKKYK